MLYANGTNVRLICVSIIQALGVPPHEEFTAKDHSGEYHPWQILHNMLGAGGEADVYLGQSTIHRQQVAIKVITQKGPLPPDAYNEVMNSFMSCVPIHFFLIIIFIRSFYETIFSQHEGRVILITSTWHWIVL